MRARRTLLVCLAIAVAGGVAGGCATTRESNERPRQSMPRTPLHSDLPLNMPCPLGIEDATVYAEDVPGAIVVTLTSMSKVDELRLRVASAAKAYGPMRGRGLGHDGKHGQGNQHGLQLIWLNRVTIAYEEVPAGALLRITPKEPHELDKVRARVHEHVLDIASRPCKSAPALPTAENIN